MKIIECPRDAMQGLDAFIPTALKAQYLALLLRTGFHTIDAGSFVSPKAIPQLRDTAEVLGMIDWQSSPSALLAIVANVRGAETAASFDAIRFIGFPLSISETFQQRNTNRSISEALNTVNEIQEICTAKGKTLVIYISMAFGNPYGDPFDASLAGSFVDILSSIGITIVSLSDTIGVSTPAQIKSLFGEISTRYPALEIGLHLHSAPILAIEKITAALDAGCRRLDGALRGYGGCPMAEDELVGNIATEKIIEVLESKGIASGIDANALAEALQFAGKIFPAS